MLVKRTWFQRNRVNVGSFIYVIHSFLEKFLEFRQHGFLKGVKNLMEMNVTEQLLERQNARFYHQITRKIDYSLQKKEERRFDNFVDKNKSSLDLIADTLHLFLISG